MPSSRWKLIGALLTSGCALFACADIFGVHNADVDGSAVDGGGIVDAPHDYIVHDAIDLDVNTAVCDGGITIVSDPSQAIWVSGTGSDGANCGTPDDPCRTITHAIAVIGGRQFVYLDNATFSEALTFGSQPGSLTIQGGFVRGDAGWTPQCDSQLSTIQGPEDGGPSAIDIKGATGITLRMLTVRSKTQGAYGGESVYAVRVFDTQRVKLDNVTLLAQSAGQGADGISQTQPAGCSLAGGSGVAGGGGAPGAAGVIGPTGYTVATAGTGGDGGTGYASQGANGTCSAAPCIVGCQ